MEQIYLAFVDTPGFFASIIRRVIGIPYVHVVLSMDADLREAYSVGRRNPAVPLIAGFEKENTLEIEAVFPHAKYKVVRMQCTAEQKKSIAVNTLYTMGGLIFMNAISLLYYRTAFHPVSDTVLSEESLYLFFFCDEYLGAEWHFAFPEAFLACDTKGFLRTGTDRNHFRRISA